MVSIAVGAALTTRCIALCWLLCYIDLRWLLSCIALCLLLGCKWGEQYGVLICCQIGDVSLALLGGGEAGCSVHDGARRLPCSPLLRMLLQILCLSRSAALAILITAPSQASPAQDSKRSTVRC